MKKHNKIRHFGHIKDNTKGTPNEISFSVLDSKRSENLNSEINPKPGKIHVFTFTLKSKGNVIINKSHINLETKQIKNKHNTTAYGSLRNNEDVLDRKQKRKKSKRLLLAMTTLIVLVFLVTALSMFINGVSKRGDYLAQLEETAQTTQDYNNQLAGFDLLVNKTINSSPRDIDYSNLVKSKEEEQVVSGEVDKKLEILSNDVNAILRNLSGSKDINAANDLIDAINAKRNAISYGQNILEYFTKAINLYTQAENVIDKIIYADSYAREAAALASSVDNEQINTSIDLSKQAINYFEQAKATIADYISNAEDVFGAGSEEIKKINTNSGFYNDYLDLRIQAQYKAIEADEAYINRNSEEIELANTESNELETKAANMIAENDNNKPADIISEIILEKKNNNEDIKSWEYEEARYNDNIESVNKYLANR